MTTPALNERFWDTTRGQIVQILRSGPKTVVELSHALGLAPNTVRTHLSNLEQQHSVQQVGTRRGTGAGKPAHVFQLTPETEERFSRAYVPVLQTLVDTLAARMGPEEFDALMHEIGVRLAPTTCPEGSSEEQLVAAAREILEKLGSFVTTARSNGSVFIEGVGCPLSAVVSNRPQVCGAVRSLLSASLGVEMRVLCDHGERPVCRFESCSPPGTR